MDFKKNILYSIRIRELLNEGYNYNQVLRILKHRRIKEAIICQNLD